MIRFHYHRQSWLPHREQRRWQRLYLFWPNGRRWRGFGVTVWAREFSVKWGQP
jgi:hypothetical protein